MKKERTRRPAPDFNIIADILLSTLRDQVLHRPIEVTSAKQNSQGRESQGSLVLSLAYCVEKLRI
jgi:hypothetical protein